MDGGEIGWRAHRKGEDDIAIGNIIGSNIFNIVFVLGIPALVAPGSIDPLAIPLLSDIPLIGRMLFAQDALVYLSFALFALVARVELKTSPDAKNKLREAAQAVGVDLSAFILSAAMERAESVLDNQRRRELSNQSWELMNQLIAEPAQPTLALKALMKRKNSDGRQA